ncbi:hypothetical protein [Caldisalinibacter kiritimatiensis]|uniref:Uncharacterized protein n=1 Tax=Caldisalinibacter kiritimatiensis TaxID=1304284 RepID=R1CNI3_9FIRM|nr:hypothetical protein [Caldisalinibacter kiritimatiensis]EOD00276.1 hypothetical protein L21TH_1679 [Caldisalinibacter kiritimatiensis]
MSIGLLLSVFTYKLALPEKNIDTIARYKVLKVVRNSIEHKLSPGDLIVIKNLPYNKSIRYYGI